MSVSHPADSLPAQLDALRSDLADLAYDLERQGRVDAADVAMMLRARLRAIAAAAEPGEQPDDTVLISLSLTP